MKNLFRTQYAQAKSMIERINQSKRMADIFRNDMNNPNFNQETAESLYKSYLNDYLSATRMFLVLVGKAEFIGELVINSTNFSQIQLNDLFTEYQNFLLENNLIEFGDIMSDEQKMAYYHAKQMEQEYHHMMQCNY